MDHPAVVRSIRLRCTGLSAAFVKGNADGYVNRMAARPEWPETTLSAGLPTMYREETAIRQLIAEIAVFRPVPVFTGYRDNNRYWQVTGKRSGVSQAVFIRNRLNYRK